MYMQQWAHQINSVITVMKFFKLEDGSGRYLGMDSSIPEHIIEQIPELITNGLIDISYEKTYSQEEFELATNPPTPTWNNTLTNHSARTDSQELMRIANQLNYTYFAWNGRIYKITNYHQSLNYEMVLDVYEIDIK